MQRRIEADVSCCLGTHRFSLAVFTYLNCPRTYLSWWADSREVGAMSFRALVYLVGNVFAMVGASPQTWHYGLTAIG